jgi:hypothetical protein
MAGDTGGNVNQRFYGYRLGGVARKEMENSESWEYESAKPRIRASMKYFSGFMKVTDTYGRNNCER